MQEENNPQNSTSSPPDFSPLFQSNYSSNGSETENFYKTYIQSPKNLCTILKTHPKNGLNTSNKEDMEWRIKNFGTNQLPPEKPLRIIDFILECLEDDTLKVLLISAIVSLIIGLLKDGIKTGWIEGMAIFGAVFIVTSISSTLNYNEQLQFRKLSEENKQKKVLVIRNGIEIEIDDDKLLVGDLLKLKIGEILTVDGIFIGNSSIITDESAINGESDLIKKNINFSSEYKNGILNFICPILISGTQIIDGSGEMIVCAVGNNSFNGRNRLLLSKDNENNSEENLTPLKKQLNDLADLIGYFGYIMAALIFIVIILKDIFIKIYYKEKIFCFTTLDTIINAFILAITVIVVAIPEGLPMAVAIALAYSLGQMKKENNLVKNLNSSETMGNVNNICTDKTGTLTKGQMVVESFYFKGKNYDAKFINMLSIQEKKLIFNNINNNMTVVETIDINGKKVLNGDMTEKALYHFMKNNINNIELNDDEEKEKYVLNFNSDNKFMCTLIKESPFYYVLYLKGAHEKVFPLLENIRSGSTVYEKFSKYKDNVTDIIKKYSSQSKRTLIFASKKISINDFKYASKIFKEKNIDFYKYLYTNLTFEFLVGIRDQLREEVPNSVLKCREAGIKVRMVTGDNIITALAISKDSNIINENQFIESIENIDNYKKLCSSYTKPNKNFSSENIRKYSLDSLNNMNEISPNDFDSPIALEGEQFRILSGNLTKIYDEKTHKIKSIHLNDKTLFAKTVKRLKVIARATPEDKFLLVFGLKQLENIVAVTGDGTNDAPALKEAHVGFAMGIRGTDIAKEAADILLLDDSFSSIITACKFGRNVYDSIRKFVQFQLTTNIVAVFMTLLGGLILKDSPLNAIQMLWVNLIMDSFASLALATDKPNENLLKRKPYKRNSSILTKFMIVNIISQGIFQIFVLVFILFYGDILFNVPSDRELEHYEWNDKNGYHFTIFFDVFVFLQVFNSINARKLNPKEKNIFEGIEDNFYYIIVQSFIVIGQIFLVTFGGRAVRTKPLSLLQHFGCALISSLSLLIGYLVKILPIDLSEKEIKDQSEIEEELEEEKRAEEIKKKLLKKKNNGVDLSLKRVIVPPRTRDIFHNKIDIKNKIDKNNNRMVSPVCVEHSRNKTPNLEGRNYNFNTSNHVVKSIQFKKNSNNKNNNNNTNYNNYKMVISNNVSYSDITDGVEKNLFDDLLSDAAKNTDDGSNTQINKVVKENNNNKVNGKKMTTPRFGFDKKMDEDCKENNPEVEKVAKNFLDDIFSEDSSGNKESKNDDKINKL